MTKWNRRAALAVPAVSAVLSACSPRDTRPPASEAAQPPARTDSLVLVLPDGGGVWFTPGRPDTAADGTVCEEHLLEIRHSTSRTPVPLLYTRGRPEIVNDTLIRAAIYRHCQPGDVYLVNLRTGFPVRER
ncbi:MAG: hypothetical protein AB7I33_12875 [Gemmatimonadales bacterium]